LFVYYVPVRFNQTKHSDYSCIWLDYNKNNIFILFDKYSDCVSQTKTKKVWGIKGKM